MGPNEMQALERLIESLPDLYRGPGGSVAVVKDGQTVLRHAWGYADLDQQIAMSADTLFPICSITKQFTCGLVLDIAKDLAGFDPMVREMLPNLQGAVPSTADLSNNQSGIRDYWALTVLHGAQPEGVFTDDDARTSFERVRSLHFQPGTSYSYSNGNFRILSDMLERKTERALGDLYAERLFGPAGMQSAVLAADTASRPSVIVGYEGTTETGFNPAVNRIHWTGDAGICASLDDMIAWEVFIDCTRDDASGLYRRLCDAPYFSATNRATYGFGIAHARCGDVALTGHGGALRGFRAQRLHAASERLSVIVMLNHESNAYGAAMKVMRAALGHPMPVEESTVQAGNTWDGYYHDAQTNLLLKLRRDGVSHLLAGFTEERDRLTVQDAQTARSEQMVLRRQGDAMLMERPAENYQGVVRPVSGTSMRDLDGRYYCAEMDAYLNCVITGGAVFMSFEGFLGTGPIHQAHAVAQDCWQLACPRSMDAPAPGNWSVLVQRGDTGQVSRLVIGCWLARNIVFEKC